MKLNDDNITSCMRFLKIFIIAFSAIFFLLGFIVFVVGCVARSNFSLGPLENALPRIHEGANLLIFVGLLLMVLGVIGILGALRENQILLLVFFVLVFFAFSFLMAAGIWAVAWKDKLGMLLDRKLREYVEALKESQATGVKTSKAKTMDWIQQKFDCCGDRTADEYPDPPQSCEGRTHQGCYETIRTAFKSNIHKVAALGITVGFFSIFGMVGSLTYCCALRERF